MDISYASGPSHNMAPQLIAFKEISHLKEPHLWSRIPYPQAHVVASLAQESVFGKESSKTLPDSLFHPGT